MKILLSIVFILISFQCYGFTPCIQGVLGIVAASCSTQTTPSDMETTVTEYAECASSSALKYVSSKIIADATTGKVCKVCLSLNKILSPVMTINLQIWGDQGGDPDPDTVLGNFGSINAADIAGSFADCWSYPTGATLVNGTTYHIVLIASATSAVNYFRWVKDEDCCAGNCEVMGRSATGADASWTDLDTTRCGMAKLYKE